MLVKVRKSLTSGVVKIPGSKSHTIRALFISSLANGQSVIRKPLYSSDAYSAISVCRAFGADIEEQGDSLIVKGVNGKPQTPENIIDVGNSGTTLRIALLTAALVEGYTVLTGDEQIRRRPMKSLISAVNNLDGVAFSTRGNGLAPVVVEGRAKGGFTKIDAVTSQFLTSLLINAPLFERDTTIEVIRLNEVPYVEMTMWWLNQQGIQYNHDNMKIFDIQGGQAYKPLNITIPGDFSSATFFMVLAAISGAEITLENLDRTDTQGDKAVIAILESMGARVTYGAGTITIKGMDLKGIEIDMNAIPDALPALAVAGCFASGKTRLYNVPQARLKETDRIAVMCNELKKMGADVEEFEDGLLVKQSTLRGTRVNGHGDHRVVMAMAVAGLCSEGETVVDTAEAIEVTFPEFGQLVREIGGEISFSENT